MTEAAADSIIDWRDSNDTPENNGAEAGFYANLPFRYNIRNGLFKTVRELLMVNGVNEDLLYGTNNNLNNLLNTNQTAGSAGASNNANNNKGWIEYLTCYSYGDNTDAQGNQRININQADESTLTQSLGLNQDQARGVVNNRSNNNQYRSTTDLVNNNARQNTGQSGSSSRQSGSSSQSTQPIDSATFANIADRITTTSSQKIIGVVNVNTVSDIVLAAFLGGDDKAYQLAENIVNYRDIQANGITSIADLLNIPSMDTTTLQKISSNITTRSNVFLIRSSAYSIRPAASAMTVQVEAVVDRSSTPIKILYWYEGETN
jgi:DNA uptake protein ComE-like DNA-binding protein